jgi:hypothetical protein
MPKKNKTNKSAPDLPAEDPPDPEAEGGASGDASDAEIDSAQAIHDINTQFQKFQARMQEQMLEMQKSFQEQLKILTARQGSQATLQILQAEQGPQVQKSKSGYRQPEFAPTAVSETNPAGISVTVAAHFEQYANKFAAYATHDSFCEDAHRFPNDTRRADLLLGSFTLQFRKAWMKKSKIKSDDDARHMSYIKIRDSIMAYAIHLEFGHNLADYFRKHPKCANTSVAQIQANLHYLLMAVPEKLDPPDVRQAAFDMFHPDIQRIMIHRNPAIAEHEYFPVEDLLDAAADAERLVKAEVRIAGQIRNARPAPTDETVLMLTGPPAPRPAPQARIEPVEEEDLDR